MSLGVAMTGLAGGVALVAGLRWVVWRGFRAPRMAVDATPATHGLAFDDVSFATANGKTLSGWMVPAAPGAPLVVMMHGWGANAATLLPLAAQLHSHGFSLLLLDARSHGRSEEDTFSSMPRFAEDIEAALSWLGPRREKIVLLGHSVGGAAAILAASRQNGVAAVVSLSAFDHPERVMRTYLDRAHIPFRPFGWLVCRYVERIIGHRFDAIAPVATIGHVRCPVLIGHGTDDSMVSPDAAQAIAARSEGRAELVLLDGIGHEGPEDYTALGQLLADFLRRVLSV
ncbi:alpha/beta hydrolase [Magnetospirillum aberrantis]|uniref:Alpha/beta fold hydrolase n=1 Tax=Magnetospirillum aberrantis SpK TaxID=908842 RepID=A0A7C9QRT2_9PROT|nr:alpha/beta fold hydrolase [Magnetospirillum aberrantis]NFV78922.1 alpha/beta fold hydrolase [Magnetospirillum aberrantis SpK]